jgi:hypothetical protein
MRVKLTYFKPSGKYYIDVVEDIKVSQEYLLLDEIKKLARTKLLPGLNPGHSDFIILVSDEEVTVPFLVFPPYTASKPYQKIGLPDA